MKNEENHVADTGEAGIDRSRLELLGILAAAGATGGCASAPSRETRGDYQTFGKQKYPYPEEKPGGEGGEGSGGDGSSH